MSKKAEGFSLRFVLINTGNISRKVLSKVLRSFDKNFERLHRDTNQKEIDMVIEEAGIVHPVEIKKATNPEKRVVKAFKVLETPNNTMGIGVVICMTDTVFPIDENNAMIPCNIL